MCMMTKIRFKSIKGRFKVPILIISCFPVFFFVYLFGLFIYLLYELFTLDEPLFDGYYSYSDFNFNSKFLKKEIQKNKSFDYLNETKIIINKAKIKNENINDLYSEFYEELKNKKNNFTTNLNIKNDYLDLTNNSNKNDFAYITNNKKFYSDDDELKKEKKNIGYCFACICEGLDFSVILIIILFAMEEEKNKKLDMLFKLKLISKIRDFFSWFFIYLIFSFIKLALLFLFIANILGEFVKKLLIIIPLYLTSHFCFSYFVWLLFYNSQNGLKKTIFLIISSIINH